MIYTSGNNSEVRGTTCCDAIVPGWGSRDTLSRVSSSLIALQQSPHVSLARHHGASRVSELEFVDVVFAHVLKV